MGEGEIAWVIEETWIGYIHYIHKDFDVIKWRKEVDSVRELHRHRQPFITKNIDEAMRFSTEAEALSWREQQPPWFRNGDQYQAREHEWVSP